MRLHGKAIQCKASRGEHVCGLRVGIYRVYHRCLCGYKWKDGVRKMKIRRK